MFGRATPNFISSHILTSFIKLIFSLPSISDATSNASKRFQRSYFELSVTFRIGVVDLAWKNICPESYSLIGMRLKVNQQIPERFGRSILIGLSHILRVPGYICLAGVAIWVTSLELLNATMLWTLRLIARLSFDQLKRF